MKPIWQINSGSGRHETRGQDPFHPRPGAGVAGRPKAASNSARESMPSTFVSACAKFCVTSTFFCASIGLICPLRSASSAAKTIAVSWATAENSLAFVRYIRPGPAL
jgi:hypothetical protein